jgi:hypothetical protein
MQPICGRALFPECVVCHVYRVQVQQYQVQDQVQDAVAVFRTVAV